MKKYFLISFLVIFSLFVFTVSVNAQSGKTQTDTEGSIKTQSTSAPCATDGTNCLTNPLSVDTPQALIGKIINAVLGVVGSLALLMFVYGGLTWMTSSGSQEKVKKGRDIIVWSAIGLAIIFASYGLVRILLTAVVK